MAKFDYKELHRHWFESCIFEADGKLVIPPDWTWCQGLMLVHRTMVQVVRTTDELFRKPDRGRKGRDGVVASKPGRSLQACLATDVEAICKAFPDHRFDPYFSLFVEIYRASPFWRSPYTQNNVALLNEFVERLRAGAKRAGFMRYVRNHERGAVKNAKRVRKYIDDLYSQYAKLLHVRLDLYYETEWPRPMVSSVSAEEIKDHWAKFTRHVRNTFGDAAVGNLWTVEYGEMKGPHLHVILNFNGHKVRQGITIAQQLGEYWQKVITGGRGRYWNINKYEDLWEAKGRRGIGMIAHSDEKRRENLVRTALYLVKTDLFVRLILPGFGKTFGHGKLKLRKKSNAGRKRKGARLTEWVETVVKKRGAFARTPPASGGDARL